MQTKHKPIHRLPTGSGHRSWNSLKRYTHIRQVGDKYDGWTWLDRATKAQHVRSKAVRGEAWYQLHAGLVDPVLPGRGRKPARPQPAKAR